ncbi:unnamed protein product [Bursaphelenchus xylophilus]|nr:unnamed protein product [Bursaphelenchus xylophilus]CAG9126843.1 unnamed protein product [Bursaphelenchus xylophilus]
MLPLHVYTLHGNYIVPRLMALFVYTCFFIHHCCVCVIDIKFILLGLERRFAFQQREVYEHDNGACGRKLLVITIGLVISETLIRCILKYFTSTETDIDLLLRDIFLLENSPAMIFVCHVVCFISLVYGFLEFHFLNHSTAHSRYSSKSLSESYQLKEVQSVIKIVRPLLWFYFACAQVCVVCAAVMVYVIYFLPEPDMKVYHHMIALENIAIGSYNLFSTIFMLLHFSKLRVIVFNDLLRLFCLNRRYSSVTPNSGFVVENAEHFQNLQSMWDQRLQKKMFG